MVTMRICIVGPEESKWKSKSGPFTVGIANIEKAKLEIRHIFRTYGNFDRFVHNIFEKVVLVSGHCPKGGVDIWAEETAKEIGIKTEIHAPEVNQWEDDFPIEGSWKETRQVRKKGYKSRNIDMAKSCDVLYCIVPKIDTEEYNVPQRGFYCMHCLQWGHPTNGGCYTRKIAEKLGKEVYLIVI